MDNSSSINFLFCKKCGELGAASFMITHGTCDEISGFLLESRHLNKFHHNQFIGTHQVVLISHRPHEIVRLDEKHENYLV